MTLDRRQTPERRETPRGERRGVRSAEDRALTALIASRLQRLMKRRGMSAAVLAQLADVSESAVRYVLAGENTSLDTLRAIATAIDVPLSALLAPKAA